MHRTFLPVFQALLLFLGGCVLPFYSRPTSGPVSHLRIVKGGPPPTQHGILLYPGAHCLWDRPAEVLPAADWAKATLPTLGEVKEAGTVVRAGEPLLIEYRSQHGSYIRSVCETTFLFTPDEGVTYAAFALTSRDARRCVLTVQATGDNGGSYGSLREVANQYEPKKCVRMQSEDGGP